MATFRKHERLKSTRIIRELMERGHSIYINPVRLAWLQTKLPSNSPAQVAFSVPKKNFRRAVDRNRIKRQMRECYRAQKEQLYLFIKEFISTTDSSKEIYVTGQLSTSTANPDGFALMFIFTGKTMPEFNDLMMKFTLTLQRLEKEIKKSGKQGNDLAD